MTIRGTCCSRGIDMTEFFLVYLAFCLFIGHLGKHRVLGFWGYFFFLSILTPVVGLVLVFASDPIPAHSREPALNMQQQGAIDYGYDQLVRSYENRIAQLIATGRITQEHADRELAPLVRDLRRTAQFGPSGTVHSPLDVVLKVLEQLPGRGEASPDRA